MASHSTKNTQNTSLSGSVKVHPHHSAIAYHIGHRARTIICCIVIAVLVFSGTVAASIWLNIDSAVRKTAIESLVTNASPAVFDPNAGKPIRFVLIGQDSRDDENAALSGDGEENAGVHNADTTMVVEISANRDFINLVSIPRDSLVDVPSCQTTNGVVPAQYGVMFNSIFSTAYAQGGDLSSAASCTVNAVNALTGLDISNFIVVDFKGLSDMIDAIGGVDICIPVHTVDANTNMDLKKGMHHLDGPAATNYARMRYGTGTDGSDIMRTTRQQYLVKSLLSEAISKNLFTQSSQLYQLALAAINSLNMDKSMANTAALVGLAMSLRNLQLDHLYMQTVPIVQSPSDPNRVEWADTADAVWQKFRDDEPLFGSSDSTDTSDNTASSDTDKEVTPDSNTTDESIPQDQSTGDLNTAMPSPTAQPTVDPVTGLITEADGTLIDPETGGTVDPETGAIRDPYTNQYVGIAYQYLNNTVCAVPANEN